MELYQRINELSQTAVRGMDEFKYYTVEEAQEAILAYKKKHPRKCKKKKVKKIQILPLAIICLIS